MNHWAESFWFFVLAIVFAGFYWLCYPDSLHNLVDLTIAVPRVWLVLIDMFSVLALLNLFAASISSVLQQKKTE